MSQLEEKAKQIVSNLSKKVLIDGDLITPSCEMFDIFNSAKMEIIGQAPECTSDEVNRAVEAAYKAQREWARMHPRKRGELLLECAHLLDKHIEELALLLTLEVAKPYKTESMAEASSFTDILKFYAGLGSELKGETIPLDPSMLTFTIRKPVGVVGGILPWNAPIMLMALKISPALVAGNAIIIKSSEEAPFAVLRAAEIMNQILPKGVFNLISGHGKGCGEALVAHPKVQKITFTGSVETGKKVYAASAEKLIPVTLELGGKSPMIVDHDADIEKAVDGAITGMRFTRQGQSCTAASRMFLHEKIYDEFKDRLLAKLNDFKIGDPFNDDIDAGAIISQKQYDKVQTYIKCLDGNKHECGQIINEGEFEKGLFCKPTIFENLPHDHKLVQEEIFGPVTCLFKWNDLDSVIELANDSSYALAATFWGKDLNRSLKATEEIQAGLVQINQNLVVKANLPYGGFKNSGLGQEASFEAMLDYFTKRKTVIINRG